MILDDEIFYQDAILYLFKKKKTGFLTTETILKEIRFQKAVNPKEDKERLDFILERMRESGWVVLNQPKLAAISPEGKEKIEKLSEERMTEIQKKLDERLT